MGDSEDDRPSKRLKSIDQEGKKVEQEDDDSIVVSRYANDRINLFFYSFPHDNEPHAHCVHPQYTHQLFPDETISYLDQNELQELKIHIHINTFDLRHWIEIDGINTPSSLQRLQSDLQIGTPEGTVFCYQASKEKLPLFSTSSFLTEHSFAPSGQRIHSFTRISPPSHSSSSSSEEEEYEVYLASHQDFNASLLLARLEKIAIWFIETADSVDFNDPRWEVLFLYRKYPSETTNSSSSVYYGLVGYMTLFTFHNPFHGDILRICQALVFPQSQHSGLGRELLLTVYRVAQERSKVTQVTVEDPSLGFQQLRNSVDFEWLMIMIMMQYLQKKEETPKEALEKITKLSSKEIMEKLKIIKSQAIFVQEATEYLQMILSLPSPSPPLLLSSPSVSSDLRKSTKSTTTIAAGATAKTLLAEKDRIDSFFSSLTDQITLHETFPEFRLRVKKHLVKTDPELKELPKEDLQKELSIAFEEKMIQYRKVLKVALRLKLLTMKE